MYLWDVFLELATMGPRWLGTIQGESQAQALDNAVQFYGYPLHDLVVNRESTSGKEADAQAIQCAVDQAPQDMIATPVRATGASLYTTRNVVGKDLQVQGLRWYVEVDLQNLEDESTAAALYRVWRDRGEWKAIRVELQ